MRIRLCPPLLVLIGILIPALGHASGNTIHLRERLAAAVPPVLLTGSPETSWSGIGEAVTFQNEGHLPRTLEEEHGFFRWGPVESGDSVSFVPWAAGTYRFTDVEHPSLAEPARGSFKVALEGPEVEGDHCTDDVMLFRYRWASQAAPDGFADDVRYRLTGDPEGHWRPWRTDVLQRGGTLSVPVVRQEYEWPTVQAGLRSRDDSVPDAALTAPGRSGAVETPAPGRAIPVFLPVHPISQAVHPLLKRLDPLPGGVDMAM